MNRREALQRVALLLGGAISTPVVQAVLSGCKPSPNYKPRTLKPEQFEVITSIADLIIPATETPGAKGTGVPEFIDLILTECYPPKDRDRFLTGLTAFEALFQQNQGKPYLQAKPEEQAEILIELDREAVAARRSGTSDLPFFGMMKELTLIGYYTSTVGANDELQFQPATNRFDGCIPLERVDGRAWAELG
ncbi:MAG: gluconate 2-dehydrogenase subunit 3 family protein [bacterium]